MAPVKDLTLTYEGVNDFDAFSQGDTVAGLLSFTLTKDTKIKSIFVKAKGEARVQWSEGSGDDESSYSSHRRYFKRKEFLVTERAQGTVLSQGLNQFKFRFKIPEMDMPSTFHGDHGRIVYTLEAKVSRSWRWPSKVEKEINFVSKSIPYNENLMCAQSGTVNKETGVFSKGQVQLSATVSRKFCSPGDSLSVVARICNSSSKSMRPKLNLQQVTVYRAGNATNSCTKSLSKVVGDTIASNSEQTVSCQMKIPDDAPYTLFNCEIISFEYQLKVYLDISFAIDPEVVFPLVIIPSHSNVAPGPYPGPSYSDFPPPAFPAELYSANTGPGAYGYQAPGTNAPSDSSQWPQQAGPNGLSSAAFPPSSVLDPGLAASPLFQQGEEPPTYTSLFPDSK